MADIDQCYALSTGDGPLRQCEILSGVRELLPKPGAAWITPPPLDQIEHPFAVVLSQDCDLEQDYYARGKNPPEIKNMLRSVLLCEAVPATEARQQPGLGGIWKQLRQNNHERYHYLSKVAPADDSVTTGFDSLILDYKRYFTVPTGDLYEQFKLGARRRTLMKSNYLEHVSTRFCYYQYRVALSVSHAQREGE